MIVFLHRRRATERLNIGIFGPEYDDLLTDEQREAYKDHMRIQMTAHKAWRRRVLGDGTLDESEFHSGSPIPPLVACASDAVPTVNQILRRRRKPSPYTALTRKGRHPMNPWEYDYVNGRAVPGYYDAEDVVVDATDVWDRHRLPRRLIWKRSDNYM